MTDTSSAEAGRNAADELVGKNPIAKMCIAVMLAAWRLYYAGRDVLQRQLVSAGKSEDEAAAILHELVLLTRQQAVHAFDTDKLATMLKTSAVQFLAAYGSQLDEDAANAKAQQDVIRRSTDISCGVPVKSETEPVISREHPTIIVGPGRAVSVVINYLSQQAVTRGGSRVILLTQAQTEWKKYCGSTRQFEKFFAKCEADVAGPVDLLAFEDVRGAIPDAPSTAAGLLVLQKRLRRVATPRRMALMLGIGGAPALWRSLGDDAIVDELEAHTDFREVRETDDNSVVFQDAWFTLTSKGLESI